MNDEISVTLIYFAGIDPVSLLYIPGLYPVHTHPPSGQFKL